MNYLKKKEESKLLQGFQKAEKISSDKYCDTFEVTRTMFRLVYVEVKLNFPLFHHTELVKLFQMANVNMGFHHYECRSAQRIVDHITSEMRKDLIKGIKNFPAPVSIITDGATDSTQNHYLVVLLQIIEDNQPKVVFYRLLKSKGERLLMI